MDAEPFLNLPFPPEGPMLSKLPSTWRWVAAGFLASVLALLPDNGLAQETAQPKPSSSQLPSLETQGKPGPVQRLGDVFTPTYPEILQVQGPAPASPVFTFGTTPAPSPPPAPGNLWANVPPTKPAPRPGLFIIPPGDAGYYSLKDFLLDEYREKPPVFPYRVLYFDNDFRYLDKPNNTQTDIFDPLKRIFLGEDFLLSTGGEVRMRFMDVRNGYVILTGLPHDYLLLRTRIYTDFWYQDYFRVYAEFLDAQSVGGDQPRLPGEANHSDLVNLFGELSLVEIDDVPVYLRGGRQQINLGSQRLISSLEWSNSTRTFEGFRAYWHGKKLDVDAFWVRPVLPDATHFDAPEAERQFLGLWSTYRPEPSQAVDAYYLYLDSTLPTSRGSLGVVAGQHVNTFGSRYSGDYEKQFLWDFEGMYQFGQWANQNLAAFAATSGLGYRCAEVPTTPQFWLYYDYASGDPHPGQGNVHRTFNQLFPFGHYYFGYLDLVGRQNIHDLNIQFSLWPTRWITAGLQFHNFWLANRRDALYNSVGAPIRRDPTGQAGRDVGRELDLFTNIHLGMHQDMLIGYSILWQGSFLERTGHTGNPELFYLQYCFRW